jgi:hypothetical protein
VKRPAGLPGVAISRSSEVLRQSFGQAVEADARPTIARGLFFCAYALGDDRRRRLLRRKDISLAFLNED